MNWKEWIAVVVLTPPALLLVLYLLGTMFEGIVRNMEEHDRCLRNATNGYEIRECR